MTDTRLKKNNSSLLVRLMFVVIWTQNTIMIYASQIFRKIPIIGRFYANFTILLIFSLFVLSFNKLIKKIKFSDVFFLFAFYIVFMATIIFQQKNTAYIKDHFIYILFTAFPMYFWGICYDHTFLKRNLFLFSIASVALYFGSLLLILSAGQMSRGYGMGAAYNILPSVLYITYWAFEKQRIRYWLLVIFSFFYMLMYGTRGPLLAFILYFCVALFFKMTNKKSVAKILLLIFAIIMAMMFISSNFILNIVADISDFFSEVGFSTRILDKLIEGEISDDSGRGSIQFQIIEAINENPIFGLGIMGDRTVLHGSYTHNIFLEIICDFGIPIGSFIIIALILIALMALKKANSKPEFYFLLLMIVFVFTKLMVSGSYIIEPYFYFMLGLCISTIRKYGKENPNDEKKLEKVY